MQQATRMPGASPAPTLCIIILYIMHTARKSHTHRKHQDARTPCGRVPNVRVDVHDLGQ